MQASTEAGVPVQEVSHQLRLSDRPDVGAESKRQAFSKLVQLQADAQQHAAKLKVYCYMQPCACLFLCRIR